MINKQRISLVKQSLKVARQLRQAKKKFDVNAIYLFVKDVDGDWLENWCEIND